MKQVAAALAILIVLVSGLAILGRIRKDKERREHLSAASTRSSGIPPVIMRMARHDPRRCQGTNSQASLQD
jgi:hypothetical protein